MKCVLDGVFAIFRFKYPVKHFEELLGWVRQFRPMARQIEQIEVIIFLSSEHFVHLSRFLIKESSECGFPQVINLLDKFIDKSGAFCNHIVKEIPAITPTLPITLNPLKISPIDYCLDYYCINTSCSRTFQEDEAYSNNALNIHDG